MFASFTFFIQTVSLLGKDTGYFMGKDYMTQEGDKAMKKAAAEYADMFGKFFSVSLQASVTPTVELDPETGDPLLAPQEVCPLHLNAYQQFYKGALFKSALILIGVTLWYQGIYHAFVFTRIQYYVCSFFNKASGGRMFSAIEWEWGTEVKVLYEAKMIDTRTKAEKRADKKEQNQNRRRSLGAEQGCRCLWAVRGHAQLPHVRHPLHSDSRHPGVLAEGGTRACSGAVQAGRHGRWRDAGQR
jgi:hypothetical protein